MGSGSSGRQQAHMNTLIWNINAHHFEMQAHFCRCVTNTNFYFYFCTRRFEPKNPTRALQASDLIRTCARHSTSFFTRFIQIVRVTRWVHDPVQDSAVSVSHPAGMPRQRRS